MKNPEQKTILLRQSDSLPFKLTPAQVTYFNLMSQGQFSIAGVFEFCHKTGEPICFREMWDLIVSLENAGLLIQPRLIDWHSSPIDEKIGHMARGHLGIHEKVSVTELKQLPFFRNLRAEILELFSSLSSVHNVASGMYLCRQGAIDRNLFILLEGQVKIFHHNENGECLLLARAGGGSILGEVGFFLGAPRTADVVMAEHGKYIQINFAESLDSIIKKEAARSLRERFNFLTALLKNPFFRHLSEITFDELLKSGKFVNLAPGEVLFRQGDLMDSFYIVIQGSVVISQNNQRINDLGPGQSLGEIAFLKSDKKRTATVSAQTQSQLIEIPTSKLVQLCFNSIAIGIHIENQGIERLTRDQKRRV